MLSHFGEGKRRIWAGGVEGKGRCKTYLGTAFQSCSVLSSLAQADFMLGAESLTGRPAGAAQSGTVRFR
jgi:hypothetical protein